MIQAGEHPQRTAERAPDNPAEALSAVVENVTALARAELRLAAAEAKAWLTRIALSAVLVWLGLLLTQIVVLLLALSPVLLSAQPPARVALAVLLALGPTLLVFLLLARELRKLKETPHESHRDH